MNLKFNTLVTKAENIFYLSGFKGSFAELILTPQKKFLITDARYKEQAKKLVKNDFEIIIIENYKEDLEQIFKKNKIKSLQFEANNFTYSKYLAYKKIFPKIKLSPIKKSLDLQRIIKTDKEIKLIQNSQKLNEKVLYQIQKLLKPGITEKEISNKIITIGYEIGADAVSFDPIVAFGKNSASPHYTPSNTKLTSKDNILIDMGFILNGYCSDMSRTFLPKNPPSELQNMYNLVLEAQENCLRNIKSGITGMQADNLSRSIFKKANLEQYFTHANGHGIGLEIHEAPSLSCKSKHKDKNIILQKNMVVTVEPGLYFEGKYGIRIEDIKVIDGKNLTQYPK